MEGMTGKEILNLIDWLKKQGFDNDKIVECIEAVEGKKPENNTEDKDQLNIGKHLDLQMTFII